jgi:hypothetical protein
MSKHTFESIFDRYDHVQTYFSIVNLSDIS